MNSKCSSFILAAIIICTFAIIGNDCISQDDTYTLDSFTVIMTVCMALSAGVFMPDLD